jgi:hypothetical protein
LATENENAFQICYQKSDPSSSDDGLPTMMHHRVSSGIQIAHKVHVKAETFELKTFPVQHKNVSQEDSTISPKTCSSEQNTNETSLSIGATKSFDKDESFYKRSRSYHGQSSKGLLK